MRKAPAQAYVNGWRSYLNYVINRLLNHIWLKKNTMELALWFRTKTD
jgi:erythromycin esterase-like protein